jgi:uncharacterized protein with HEPN domain
MPHSAAAYLSDIIDACDAIADVLSGVDLEIYQSRRPIRSAVERELITIGEAMGAVGRVAPEMSDEVPNARMIVGLRNVLTHDYAAVDDETVYGVAESDVPTLRLMCAALLECTGEAD